MKVLVFSNMYPSKDKPQFGIYVYNQVRVLENMGFECKVISLKSKGNKYLRYLDFLINGLMYSLIKGKSYDIVHAHYAFPPGVFAMLHKMRYKSKMIVTAHGSDINKMPDKSSSLDRWIKRILRCCDSVICVSQNLKTKIVERYGMDHNEIEVIPMGINTEMFRKENRDLTRTQLNLPLDKRIILFVGNFYAAKGVLDVIEAFKKLKMRKKMLILIGDKTVEKKTQNRIDKILEKNIIVLNPQPQDMIAKYMNAADVFTLPSYSEGFNLVTLEAMATETMVVTSDIEAFDYLKEDTVIKARMGDVENLKNGLEEALRLLGLDRDTNFLEEGSLDGYLVEEYVKNGLAIAKENSMKEKAKKVGNVYRALCGKELEADRSVNL